MNLLVQFSVQIFFFCSNFVGFLIRHGLTDYQIGKKLMGGAQRGISSQIVLQLRANDCLNSGLWIINVTERL